MHSKNRPLQAPRPAGGFTRRVPLLSESEKARPSAFATGLCRNGSIRRSATFHRKPPCMSCTATTRCIRGSILRAGVPPCCQRAKAHAQRFCSGTLPSATIRRGPAFTESHPRMPCSATTGCICGNYFTRRVPSCCQRAKVHVQRFCDVFCYNATIRRPASSENRPRIPCSAMTGCIRGSILRAGVPPYCQRTKEHA